MPTTTIKKSAYLRGRIGWQGLRASEFLEEGPYLITGTDFDDGGIDWSKCYHVSDRRFAEGAYIHIRHGDLLITKDGTIGKVAYVSECPEKAVLNSGIFLLRCSDSSFEHRWFFHLLRSDHFAKFLRLNLNGSTINHLYQYVFERYEFPVPDKGTQQRIAAVLDSIEEQIHLTEALIAKYQLIKAGLMHDLFTRGVTADGKLRPPREQAPELYQETPIGWVPKDWQYELLDNLAVRGSGHTPNKNFPEYWNGGIKWVSLADSYRLDRLTIDETEYEISPLGIQNSSAVVHPAGTVVLSRDAGVGKSAITSQPMAVSQHFMCWRCDGRLDKYFLYYWLQLKKRMFENIAMGSTILTIGLQYFKKLKIAAPQDASEQQRIGTIMQSADQRIFMLEKDLHKLRQQKLGLMHDLLTGEVRVPLATPAPEPANV